MDSSDQPDVLVIGAGLTGISASLRLAQSGLSVVVVDSPLPHAQGLIGGFARFSGAKFSLPPAGMGLLPVAGSASKLQAVIESVLGMLELSESMTQRSLDRHEGNSLTLRSYQSILLTPNEISALLNRLSKQVEAKAKLIRGRAVRMHRSSNKWTVNISTNEKTWDIHADSIFYAAGRLSDDILVKAGAIPVEGKGLDIGVRLEFQNKNALSKLRQLGPDAKILQGGCRTFCLNSPGEIYRYEYEGLSIPGGVVAAPETSSANVGVLLRLKEKTQALSAIKDSAKNYSDQMLAESERLHSGDQVYLAPVLGLVFGSYHTEQIRVFIDHLHNEGLIDLTSKHRVHMPLLDWHWNTFGQPCSHRTNLPNVFALGDSAGHARGLLQACISGWLAAEEYLS